jgi:FixJ family two-component response regulator
MVLAHLSRDHGKASAALGDLLRLLKNSNCDVPVIIITGKPSARSEAFYLESGALGFFRKPVDGEALVEMIGSVCA